MNHFKLAFGKNTHKIKQQKNKKEANNPPQAYLKPPQKQPNK